ncbi:MAG: radical SAM protein [Treponema sp.]|nr:radical SAM protein [Treponema sp.]MEE3313746.1 radical SAM protein [Treponema sp.]
MKHNTSIVPKLLFSHPRLAFGLARAFSKMEIARRFKKRHTYGYNHMKNFALIYLKLTPVCNLHCVMCGQRGDRGVLRGKAGQDAAKTIVPLEGYKKLIDELKSVKPIYYVWGGEPFLYPQLCELVKYIQDSGSLCAINTNGTLLEKYAERIVADGWHNIFVSLDAFRDVNDAMRGKGSYDNVVKGFEAINREKKKQGKSLPIMGVVTTVTSMNYEVLPDLAEACKEFDLTWHIYNLGTYTNDEILETHKKYMKEHLDTDIYMLDGYNTGYNKGIDGAKAHAILNKIHHTDYGYLSITVPALNPEKTHEYYAELDTHVRDSCIVPWCQANVCYNGDVTFCADYNEYVLGNIQEQSFKEIYNGDRANKFREEILKCEGRIFPGCVRCYQNMLFGAKIKGY